MSTTLVSETYIIYVPNLNQTHELDVNIRLEDWVEDLGFMPSLCIYTFCETFRPLSSTLIDVGHMCYCYDWAKSFDKLKRALTSIFVMSFHGKNLPC